MLRKFKKVILGLAAIIAIFYILVLITAWI